MRQRSFSSLALVGLIAACGCDSKPPAPAAAPGGIVSLSPAASDLIVAMGLGDRVVGVSAYEANDDLHKRLPKVGDYERIDWERLAELRPAVLVVQGKPDRLPAGTQEHCSALNIKPVILQIDRLDDIDTAARQIADAAGHPDNADRLIDLNRRRKELLKDHVPAETVPTLIVLGDEGTQVVGRDNFIDDALALAGGTNVMKAAGYATLDAEKLRQLKPQVVFLLLPNADDATVERARVAVQTQIDWHAGNPIIPIRDKDVLLPGTAALRLAETMQGRLRETQ